MIFRIMKKIICTCLLVLTGIQIAPTLFTCSAQSLQLYGIIGDRLVSVDKTTGDATDIGPTCGLSEIRELTWVENLGKLYGIADPFTDPKIVCIDRNSGQATYVATISITAPVPLGVGLMESFAYNPADGLLYGAVNELPFPQSASSNRLIAIDPITGDATHLAFITGTIQNEADDMFFIDGTAYVVDGNGVNNFSLYTLDLDVNIGTATLINISNSPLAHGFAYDAPAQTLFVSDWNNQHFLAQLDPATAQGTVIGTTHASSEFNDGLMVALAAAPAPGGAISCDMPELDIQGNGMSITNGDATPDPADHTDFGTAVIGLTTVSRTFEIHNLGTVDLNLTGSSSYIAISGSAAFSLSLAPGTPVASGANTVFEILFDPASAGAHAAVITVENDDCNEAAYSFTIQGEATDCQVNPEICDGQDNDCDGNTDEGFDQDGDGIADCFDNCPDDANPGQEDADCDGVGDACDLCDGGDDSVDENGDGLPDCAYPPPFEDVLLEWVCDNSTHKVYICHKPDNQELTLCVDYHAVDGHLGHGDYLGPCGNADCSASNLMTNPAGVNHVSAPGSRHFDFYLFPNPARERIYVLLPVKERSATMELILQDCLGKVIFTRTIPDDAGAAAEIDLGGYSAGNGVFFVTVILDGVRETRRVTVFN